MKRFAWLILLISVGLNLGLGWRLLNRYRAPAAESWGSLDNGSEGCSWRQGRAGRDGRSGGGMIGQRRGNLFRPAPGDSGDITAPAKCGERTCSDAQ